MLLLKSFQEFSSDLNMREQREDTPEWIEWKEQMYDKLCDKYQEVLTEMSKDVTISYEKFKQVEEWKEK